MRRLRMHLVTATLALGVAAPRAADAQVAGQKQDRMTQQIQLLDQQIQRMDRIRDRIHRLDRNLVLQMDRLRDQDRLREHQRLRDLCQAMNDMAGPMRQNMERTREMARDPLFQRDAEMQREMERLRQHWQMMADEMEKGVGIVERLQQRLARP